MGGRCTAPTHTAFCVSPWELRALTQNIPSANIRVCTWASVKFAIPLAIFYLALQHDSSGQAIVPTVIFPPAACWKLLLTITLSRRNSQLIQEVPQIKKQTRKTAEIVVWYCKRLTPENELVGLTPAAISLWSSYGVHFPLYTLHTWWTDAISASLQILRKVLDDLGDPQVPCSFWGMVGQYIVNYTCFSF